MTDATGEGGGTTEDDRFSGTVQFEETVALSDSRFAELSSVAGGVALVAAVAMVLLVPLSVVLFFGFVAAMSGNSIVAVVADVASGLPTAALLFLAVFALFVLGVPLFAVVSAVRRGRLGPKDEVHTRVTDRGIEIDREGGRLGQSSGVTVSFETVTAVEYNDPDGDIRVELGDINAKKFIGGRSGDWVRIERADGPAVYVGSDRHRALADVVADMAPGVDDAEPFS